LWNRYAFAEGHAQRDFRERAAAHPYQIGNRRWMRLRFKDAYHAA
jgi:hypothetical protein